MKVSTFAQQPAPAIGVPAPVPDFLSTWLTDVEGVSLATGVVVAVIGGAMVCAGIACARTAGFRDEVSGRPLWWGGGLVGIGVLTLIVRWLLG